MSNVTQRQEVDLCDALFVYIISLGLFEYLFSKSTAIQLELDQALQSPGPSGSFPLLLSLSQQSVKLVVPPNRVIAQIQSA